MSEENTPNNDPLNNAVENTSEEASGSESIANPTHKQSQNQTTTHTVASGDGTLASAGGDSDSTSGAGADSSEEDSSEGATSSDSDSSGAGTSSGDSSSSVVDSSSSSDGASTEGETTGSSTQSVGGSPEGGDATTGDSSEAGASGATASSGGSADGSTAESSDSGVDTQTTEETFNVEVTDEIGESFDSETTSETFSVEFTSENDGPEAGAPLELSMQEDGSFIFTQEQLLANASDVDGDTLSASNLTVGANAEVTDNGDGTFTVTPSADWNGALDIGFDISDGTETVSASGVLAVTAVNDEAVVADQSFAVDEDGTITITDAELLAGASDVDGDTLSIADVSYTGTDGVFTDNGDGTYSFAPNENFNGSVDLGFSVSDGTATTDANIDITVNDVNDAPVAGSTSYSVSEDGTLSFSDAQLLANSSDVDGTVTVDSVGYTGTDGILTDNGDGTYSFAPNADFNGDVSIDVTVIDDDGATDTATADVTTLAVNDTPVVSGNLAYNVNEDGSITFSQEQLLANASDVDGDALSASNLSADNATVTDNGDGTFTVAPDADFNGDIAISFDVSDGAATAAAGVDLTVNPMNDVAVVADQSFAVDEDGTLTITDAQLLAGATDIDGDALSVADVSYTGTDGVFTDNGDGTYSFAPNENFNGSVDLGFSVSDGTATTAANIDITVNDVNDAPVAGSTSYSVSEDGTLSFSDAQLLANSGDVDGTVTVDSVGYTGTDGILTDNGDGTYSFAPNADFNGDVSIDVTVVDDDGATDTTTADVTTLAVNDTPVVSGNLAYNVNEDGSITFSQEQLLANASDVDGDALSASNLIADNATVTDNGDGTFTVAPDADFNGDIAISFDVSDGLETVATAVDLTVNPVNDVAVVADQSFAVDEDGTITITDAQLLAGATDVDGDTLSIADVSYTGTDGVFTDNGDGTYSFAPNENFNGSVDLGFSVSDGTATTDANIDITVNDVNDAPVAGSTSYSMDEDGTLTFSDAQLLANSSDVDGTVTLNSVGYTGTDGILTDNGDGTYSFAPNENFNGDVSIDVTVIDDDGAIASSNAQVEVVPVNDPPVAGGVCGSMSEDGTITFSEEQLLASSSDVDEDNLSVSGISYTGTDGVFTDNGDGTYSFAPNENYNGEITFSVTVTDGTASDTTYDSCIMVEDVNDVPVAGSTSYSVGEDGTLTFSDAQLLANSTDVDGSVSVDSVAYAGTDGLLTENGDGTYSFAPNENFNGDVSLDVTIIDDDGATVSTSADVTIIDINDAPVAGSTSYSVSEDGTLSFSDAQLLANSSDVDGTVTVDSVGYTGTDGILTDN
ncbi:MAG: tandem-95 repeat protein, partial [Pseudomonadales bacterium]